MTMQILEILYKYYATSCSIMHSYILGSYTYMQSLTSYIFSAESKYVLALHAYLYGSYQSCF